MSAPVTPTPAPPAPESRFKIRVEDIAAYDWEAVLAGQNSKECETYHAPLFAKARECQAAGDDRGYRVYAFLSTIASFYANYDDRVAPYRPLWSGFDGKRALCPDDLVREDFLVLREILEKIQDADFRARVGDLLWVCRKDFKSAQIAIASFLESAARLKSVDGWPTFAERLERAAQIAAIKGFEVMEAQVGAALEAYLTEFQGNPEAGLLCCRLMRILQKSGLGDKKKYGDLAELLANDFAKAGNWHFSENYWEVAEDWRRREKDEVGAKRCRLAAAECNISRADAASTEGKPNFGYRASWMGKGLEALRRAQADPVRIADIHRQYLVLQKQALSEMGTIEVDPDAIPGLRENEEKVRAAATAHVSGYPSERAITHFIHVTKPSDFEALKVRLEKISESTIFDKIFSTTAVDRAGKVADTIEPILGSEEDAANLRKRLVQQAAEIDWPIQVRWKIDPARLRLLQEHPLRRDDLRFFIESNPFVPPGHEMMYLRGFQAGFFGDWLVAMHLLIPQVEASIRHVFQQHGIITSGVDSDGTQKEKDLNQLLWFPQMEEIFGPDIAFDLRGILVERFGHNFRNESAHGLMPAAAFYQEAAAYLWWLLMRLCWMGYRSAQQQLVDPNSGDKRV